MKKIILLTTLQLTILLSSTFVMTPGQPLVKSEEETASPTETAPTTTTNSSTDTNIISQSLPIQAFNVLDYGLKGDGVTDDTAALKALAGNTNVTNWYIPSGKSILIKNINIPSHLKAIYGGGTIITKANTDLSSGAASGALNLKNSLDGFIIDHITFLTENKSTNPSGLQANQNNPNLWPYMDHSYNGPSGRAWRWNGQINILGTIPHNNIEIRNCVIDMSHFKFNGIKVYGGSGELNVPGQINRNLNIHNNKIQNYGEFGMELIALGYSRNENSKTLQNCRIYNNHFTNGGQAISFVMIRAGKSDGSKDGTENYIYNNLIENASWGIELGGARGTYIHNNKMIGIRKRGISKSDASSYMPHEGKNFWYDNHIEHITESFDDQFELIGSVDEFYGNYFQGFFNFREQAGYSQNAGYWHDNTLVANLRTSVSSTIFLKCMTAGKFENNDIYGMGGGVSRGFMSYSDGTCSVGAGGTSLQVINNTIHLQKSGAICVDVPSGNAITQSGNSCITSYTSSAPTSRSGAGLSDPNNVGVQ